MQSFMKSFGRTASNNNEGGLDSLEALQTSIDLIESQEKSFDHEKAVHRREERNNHSLDESNIKTDEYQGRLMAATDCLQKKQGRGILGLCRRLSIDRRRRSSASRRPSSPLSALVNAYVEPSVFARGGSYCLPHPEKADKGGEDAYIMCTAPDGTMITAVLDGVGGWAAVGVDSGMYSRALAERIGIEFDAWVGRQTMMKSRKMPARAFMQESQRPLLTILERAFEHVDDLGIPGTCTACLSLLLPCGKLHVLNLGDSGLRVIRNSRIVFATVEQQVSFNYPRQIGTGSVDIPADGDYAIVDVQTGDLIVTGSDGVWDNVWEHEYLALIRDSRNLEYQTSLDLLAGKIADTAQMRGRDPNYLSPFASNALRAGLTNCLGGKLDDTTVVVQKVWASVASA